MAIALGLDEIFHRGDFVARELAAKGLRTTRLFIEPAALAVDAREAQFSGEHLEPRIFEKLEHFLR